MPGFLPSIYLYLFSYRIPFFRACFLFILMPIFLHTSSVALSYFIPNDPMGECLGKNSCKSFHFLYSHLNGTLFFGSVKAMNNYYYKRTAITDILLTDKHLLFTLYFFCEIALFWVKNFKGKIFDGQEFPKGEPTATLCGVNYQLFAVILLK